MQKSNCRYNMIIKEVSARAIKNSRNNPTIEITVNGQKASAPEGASKGKHEAQPYRKSLKQSIKDINSLRLTFDISSFSDLSKLEAFIKNKFKLKKPQDFGANTLFALEAAILKALAKQNKKQLWQVINPNAKQLPTPVGNAVGGGLHSTQFKIHPLFQEFLLIPRGKTFKQKYNVMQQVYKQIKKQLKASKTNDEGALQTTLNTAAVLSILQKHQAKVDIGLDIAASSFYKNKLYHYKEAKLNSNEQIAHINQLIKNYNLLYIEDPMQQDDFKGFSKITRSNKHLVVGDDLTTTHITPLKKAIKNKSINAMIVKPNQNGSLITLANIVKMCKKKGIKTVLSHRSGETLDTTIADLAFALQTDFIKTGIETKYREVKLKRLVQIEKQIS